MTTEGEAQVISPHATLLHASTPSDHADSHAHSHGLPQVPRAGGVPGHATVSASPYHAGMEQWLLHVSQAANLDLRCFMHIFVVNGTCGSVGVSASVRSCTRVSE